jgi:poly [ADP-ribose] polymerase 2/3/4
MAGTRAAKKRAATPEAETSTAANGSQPGPKRAKRGVKSTNDNDVQQEAPKPTKSLRAKSSTNPKSQNSPAADDEVDDVAQPAPAKGKTQAKSKAKSAATADNVLGIDSVESAPSKSGSKAKGKRKAEVEDDDAVAGTSPPSRPAAKGKGTAKVKAQPVDDDDDDDDDDEAEEDEKLPIIGGATDGNPPQMAEAQFAKAKNLQVQLDEECQLPSFNVHIDADTGIIYDAALNQTNAGANNNKFYKIQVRATSPA